MDRACVKTRADETRKDTVGFISTHRACIHRHFAPMSPHGRWRGYCLRLWIGESDAAGISSWHFFGNWPEPCYHLERSARWMRCEPDGKTVLLAIRNRTGDRRCDAATEAGPLKRGERHGAQTPARDFERYPSSATATT